MSLFDDFEGTTHQQWHDRIIKDLKGKDFNENLVWKFEEGIEVQPFYTVENLKNNKSKSFNLKNESTVWENRFVIKINTIIEANKKALYVLSRGVNSIQFIGNISSQEEFNLLVKDIDVSIIHVHFYNSKPNQTATFFSTYILNNRINLVNSNYSISFDYINNLLTNGNWIIDEQKDLEELLLLQKNSIPFKTITVNGLAFNNAGATIIQELAYSFSQAVEYINFLTDKGLKINDIVPKITFNFGVGSNYFFEIAKIRAAKILWKIILDEYQANETSIYINSTTTITNFSCFDQHNNILRTTTEAMSAIVGGSNSISILPFDTAFENTTDFSERIAINIQHILKEETFLDKVADISKGSYYIESLTDEMVEKALSLFKEIEQNGGFLENIENGTIQDAIHQVAQYQQELFIEGKKTLLGVNKHHNKALPNLSFNETKTINKVTQTKVLQTIRYSSKIEKNTILKNV